MQVTKVRLDALQLDASNARAHDARNLDVIDSSLREFGQVENLVVQKSTMRVIGGNGRVRALRDAGETHAYVHLLDIGNDRATKLALALNRSAELARWDLDQLQETIGELQGNDIEVDDIGFSPEELQVLMPKIDVEGPGPDSEPKADEQFLVLVTCSSEQEQARLLARFSQEGLNCRAMVS